MHEEIELIDGRGELLGTRHLPGVPALAGVVLCSAVPFDAPLDAGRSARLGRRLAAAGVAVQRFRRLGAPTDDDLATLDFSALVDDARGAVDTVRERTGVERVGLVGLRLGALVAARVARDLPDAPLALWEPVVDPRAAVEAAAQVRAGRSPRGALRAVDEVADTPAFDMFATPLAAELAGGTAVGGLLDELGHRPRPLLLVQTGPGARVLRAEYAAVVARARALGYDVETACHPCDGWRARVPVPVADPAEVVDDTASWLSARLAPRGGGGGRPRAAATPVGAAPALPIDAGGATP